MIISAYHNYLEIVKALIAAGANLTHKDSVSPRQFGKQATDRAKSAAVKEAIAAGPPSLRLRVPISDYSPAISDRDSSRASPRGPRAKLTTNRSSVMSRSSSAARTLRTSSPARQEVGSSLDKIPRAPRASSVSRSSSQKHLVPDKRKQFREEMDKHIKASTKTLGTKVAEDCLSSVSSALTSELDHAQDIILQELTGLFKKQTQQMVIQLKSSVSAMLDQALAAKGITSDPTVLRDIKVDATLKAKPRQKISPGRPTKAHEKLVDMPDEVDLSLSKHTPENFDSLREDMYNHIDKHMEDLTLKLHKLIKTQIAAEVNSRVARTRNYLVSVLKDNLEEVSLEVRRGLETSVKGRLEEVLVRKPSQPYFQTDEESSSIDRYYSPPKSPEDTRVKAITERMPKSAKNILHRIETRQSEESKDEPSPRRLKQKSARSTSTGKLRENVPVTNVGAALQQFMRPS